MNPSLRKALTASGPLLGLVFVYVLFAALTAWQGEGSRDAFLSLYNSKTIVTQAVIVGIGALGMTLVIIAGGIDLSVGSQVALATVVIAWVLREYGGDTAGVGLSLGAAALGILACGACGFLNGLMSALFRIVPFIITLGMMQIARGVAKWLAEEQTIVTPDSMLFEVMTVEPKPDVATSVAPALWVAAALVILLALALRYTVFGRHVFAIGSNEATARLCGINVTLQRIWIYTLCGLFTGVAGVMQFGNLTVGDPTAAVGMELDIIAAVVIGGGSLSGGEGSAVGSVVGALIMAVLRNGCTMVGVPNFVQDIVIGVIIISAVAIDRLKHRAAA